MLNRLNYFIMSAGLLVLVACSSNSGKQVEWQILLLFTMD